MVVGVLNDWGTLAPVEPFFGLEIDSDGSKGMKTIGVGRYGFGLFVAIAMLAGCGGSQAGMTGAIPQTAMTAQGQAHMAPGSYSAILYVTGENFTTMLSYPGLKIIGKLSPETSFGQGCPDSATGDIYFPAIVSSRSFEILEFAYGGAVPIETIAVPQGYTLGGCGVDPTSGNLAVPYQGTSGYVAVYPRGSNQPIEYADPNMTYYANCGYDIQGNLFVDGYSKTGFLLDELPKGGSNLIEISSTLDVYAGPIHWDGKHIALETPAIKRLHIPMIIYRISVSGSSATVVGTTRLKYAKGAAWIQGHTAIAGRLGGGPRERYVAFYRYPKGGKPYEVFKGMPPVEVYAFAVITGV
jgi:hypothetical protein